MAIRIITDSACDMGVHYRFEYLHFSRCKSWIIHFNTSFCLKFSTCDMGVLTFAYIIYPKTPPKSRVFTIKFMNFLLTISRRGEQVLKKRISSQISTAIWAPKYLKKFSGEILIKDEDMPKKGNYKFHTYGTNSNTFEFTESKTKNPGYHTFYFNLDEEDLKFKSYNHMIIYHFF